MKLILPVALIFFAISFGRAQNTSRLTYKWKRHFGVTTGMSCGKYLYGEAGLGFFMIYDNDILSFFPQDGFGVNTSVEFTHVEKFISVPKIQIHGSFKGFTAAASVLHYIEDGFQNQFVFRPEIGYGLVNFHVTYGYNFDLNQSSFFRKNLHCVNLKLVIPFYSKE